MPHEDTGGGGFPGETSSPTSLRLPHTPQFAGAKPFSTLLLCIATSPLGGDILYLFDVSVSWEILGSLKVGLVSVLFIAGCSDLKLLNTWQGCKMLLLNNE